MDQNNNNNNRGGVRNRNGGRLETFVPLFQARGSVNRHSANNSGRIPSTISKLSLVESAALSTARMNSYENGPPNQPAPMPPSSQRRNRIRQSARSVRTSSVHSFIPTQNSAERLNLYIDRHEGLDQTEDDIVPGGVTFRDDPKTPREKLKQNLRIVLPHLGLVILSAVYTLLGAAVFHYLEGPFEMHIRNATAHRVQNLKDRIIAQLWTMAKELPPSELEISLQNSFLLHNNTALLNETKLPPLVTKSYHLSAMESFKEWSVVANTGFDLIIKDVFIDYTKNYMLPEDIINGTTGRNKWDFGSSIFFSWTAITTIGYGHIVPRTLAGRISCLLYALFGIPLILVTIADLGRFLAGGIIWVHNSFLKLRKDCCRRIARCFRCLCCKLPAKKSTKKSQQQTTSNGGTVRTNQNHIGNHRGFVRTRLQNADNVSDAGTFEDVSEIPTQEGTSSEDTHARADELDEFEGLQPERRVSVLFILFIMLGYTAGGACLMQLWENWNFVDAFYFCAVTVTTIGFGDIVPTNQTFLPATLCYIVVGLIITTMCIDLVGSEYIRDIHFYGRSLGRSFLTIGGKVVHLGEVFSYVAFLQKNYGLTADQLDKLAQLPEEYLLDCMINGRQPDLNWIGGRPFVPPDIFYFKWIEHPRTLSYASERVLASMESLDLNTSRCSTARTLTPREYYQKILLHYAKQMQNSNPGIGQHQFINQPQQSTSGRIPHSVSANNNLDPYMFSRQQSMTDRTGTAIIALP